MANEVTGHEYSGGDADLELTQGTEIDQYRILRHLGQGGMATVYLARDTMLGRRAVLKFISSKTIDESHLEFFRQEAMALGQFSHPNIVTIYGVGTYGGNPYLAMEFVEGESLRDRLESDTLVAKEAERIALAIATAIAEAHKRDIIHGDLKPENIIIGRDGRARVLDFGLAKLMTQVQAEGLKPLTMAHSSSTTEEEAAAGSRMATIRLDAPDVDDELTSGMKGTPGYMSPEQWLGHARTQAVDLWAFGVIMFELFTGSRPYRETDLISMLRDVASDATAPAMIAPADVAPAIVELASRCLAKTASRRPNAGEAVRVLEELVFGKLTARVERDSPFRGLDAFTERDSAFFFGRDEEIGTFIERTRTEVIMPVVGASGVGKSSFVQAGIIPRLRERGAWTIIRIRPGAQPFRALASRLVDQRTTRFQTSLPHLLASEVEPLTKHLQDNPRGLAMLLQSRAELDQANVLLLVDQLEEVSTLVADRQTRLAFLAAICQAADDPSERVRVIFTVRDDFLTRLAESPEARMALSKVTVLRSPDRTSLEEILVRSAKSVGYTYDDPALVTEMISAVAEEASALPLVQFAATMLWQRRDEKNRKLLSSAYQAIGGVQGALATHANSIMAGFSEKQSRLVRDLMLRLVTPDGTRQVASRADLVNALQEGAAEVLQTLVNSRLLTARQVFEESYVELSHESLVHTWDRLKHWLEEGREELVFLAQVEQAASLWERRGRNRNEVWTGEALHEALRLLDRFDSKLAPTSRAFIDASLHSEAQRKRLRQILTGLGAAALLVIAVISVITAVRFGEKKDIAETNQAQAEAEGARSAFIRNDYISAGAQLRSSLEKRDSALARSLLSKLDAEPMLWQHELPYNLQAVAFRPDGQEIAVASIDNVVYLLDRQTAQRRMLRDLKNQILSVAYSPDGSLIVASDWGGAVGVWNRDGEGFRTTTKHKWGPSRIAVTQQHIVSTSTDGAVVFYDHALSVIKADTESTAEALSLSISPDERNAWVGYKDGKLRIFLVATGAESKAIVTRKNQPINALAVTPNQLLLGYADGIVELRDLQTLATIHSIAAHDSPVRAVHFSSHGLVSSGLDYIRIFDPNTGTRLRQYVREPTEAYSLDVLGDLAVSAGFVGKTVRLWDFSRASTATTEHGHRAQGLRARFSPDGRLVASGSEDRTIRLWSTESGEEVAVFLGHRDTINALDFDPQNRWLASSGYENDVLVWDMASRTLLKRLVAHTDGVYEVFFSAKGDLLYSASQDGTVRAWSTTTWLQVEHSSVGVALNSAALGSDGHIYALGYDSHFVWKSLRDKPERRVGGGWGISVTKDRYSVTGLDGKVAVFDLWGRVVRSATHPGLSAYWAHLTPDAQKLAVPFSDSRVRLFSLDDFTHPIDIFGHRGVVAEASVSGDGAVIASTGDDGTLRLWSTTDGAPKWFGRTLLENGASYSHRGWSGEPNPAWKVPVADRARLANDHDGDLCVVTQDRHIERLNRQGVVMFRRALLPDQPANEVHATKQACLTREGKRVVAHTETSATVLSNDAIALTFNAESFAIVLDGKALFFDSTTLQPLRELVVGRGATAAALLSDGFAVGFANGALELVNDYAQRKTITLEQQPSAQLTLIQEGPSQGIVLGFSNGVVGLYGRKGEALLTRKWHGAAQRLVNIGHDLHVMTELGDTGVLPLETYATPYCQLLDRVQRTLLVSWQNGQAVHAEANKTSTCR